MENIDLNLSTLNGGALQEKFEYEMKNVMENILDKNTDPTKKRSVTLKIDMIPDKERELMVLSCSSQSKIVPREETTTKVLFGRNDHTGYLEAAELKSGAKGQMFIDPDDMTIKTDTGQSVEELEKSDKTEIVDFKQRKSN
ncbi:hypothetical protein [Enterococcus pallens]|uniref:Replication terminator protein n=1 Tax=Enterococcus pallens ATCC BAA-351 TaxID=1158607 RepID=R2SU75_9ENTE|nr:hypothetical protein [Enterococcus pallens]EOH96356.1 hypothetical protein UAU_01006 [Enterococcus pallens ATCC BAA-351]EOU14431.1 hypothetical protein I588_04788 [Enterococcus pallens ATCC BAA-351]OJG81081.1 hypothetical protein RV10_GL004080 [Enterococcus pallens]